VKYLNLLLSLIVLALASCSSKERALAYTGPALLPMQVATLASRYRLNMKTDQEFIILKVGEITFDNSHRFVDVLPGKYTVMLSHRGPFRSHRKHYNKVVDNLGYCSMRSRFIIELELESGRTYFFDVKEERQQFVPGSSSQLVVSSARHNTKESLRVEQVRYEEVPYQWKCQTSTPDVFDFFTD
jgi:hypothetical protein